VAQRLLSHLRNRPDGVASSPGHTLRLLQVHYTLEQWDAALALAQELVATAPEGRDVLGWLGVVYARTGRPAEARSVLDHLGNLGVPYDWGRTPAWQARIQAVLGERERAMELLQQADENGWCFYRISRHIDMDFESLRGYPPFEEFMRPKG
jgi:hypothetical protein